MAIRFIGDPQPPGVPPSPTAAGHQQQHWAQWLWIPDYPMRGQGGHGAPCCALPPLPLGVTLGECPGLSPAMGRRVRGQGWRAGDVPLWPAGFVMGCVFLGLAGRHVRGLQEKLQVIYEGE